MHENNWKFLEERRTYMKKNFEMFEVDTWIEPNEEKIVDTVNKSIEIFYLKEQEKLLTYREFLWSQFRITQKKWWILQMLLLVGIGIALYFNQEIFIIQRGLGITSVLFVILIIPELWKNKSNQCRESNVICKLPCKNIQNAVSNITSTKPNKKIRVEYICLRE